MITNDEAVRAADTTCPAVADGKVLPGSHTDDIRLVASSAEVLCQQREGADLYRRAHNVRDEEVASLPPSAKKAGADLMLWLVSGQMPASRWWPASLHAVAGMASDFLRRHDPLQFPGAGATPQAYRGAGVFDRPSLQQSQLQQQSQPANSAHRPPGALSNINRGVEDFLMQRQLWGGEGHHRSSGKLLVCALAFARRDALSRLALVRQIQSVKGHYGGLVDEALSDEHQQSIIRHWLAHNVFGQSLERFVENRLIDHADNGAAQSAFNTLAIRNHLQNRLASHLQDHDPQAQTRDWIWSNVVLHALPILRMSDTYCENLGPQDMAWGQINAGLLLAQRIGQDINSVTPAEALALGQLLLARVKEEGAVGAQEWLQLFRLPSLLHYAQAHSAMMRNRSTGLDADLEMRALNDYFAQHDRRLREDSPLARFDQALSQYQTRRELAEQIIADQCPGMDPDSYLNLVETFCRQTPHSSPYEDPVWLENINRKYAAQVDRISTHYGELDQLLLLGAWGKLKEEEINFIGHAGMQRANVMFSRTHELRYGGVAASNAHAQDGQRVGAALGVELFVARRGEEERIYAQRNDGNGMYSVVRVDRIAANYFPLMENARPRQEPGFELKIACYGKPLKQSTQSIAVLIDAIAQQHKTDFGRQLSDFGKKPTKLEKTAAFALSLIPLYTCVTAAQAGKVEEAVLACSIDAVSLLPIIGSVFSMQAKFGQALGVGALQVGRNAIAELALQQSFKQAIKTGGRGLLRHALLPASNAIGRKELGLLAMQSLRAMDPGMELAGSLTKKSALQILHLGGQVSDYLPALQGILPTLQRAAKNLPAEVKATRYARLAGIDEDIPVAVLQGQKYRGQDVYAKCNPSTGEPYGAKYVLDHEHKLTPIPIDQAHRLKNVLTQGLGGKGGPRQVKKWVQGRRHFPAGNSDAHAGAGPAGRQDLLEMIERTRTELRQLELPQPGVSRSAAHAAASAPAAGPSSALAGEFSFNPEAVKLFREDSTGRPVFGGILKKGGTRFTIGHYDLDKNVFWVIAGKGKKQEAFFYKDDQAWLEKISASRLQQCVVTDEQRTAVLKALGIDVKLSLNTFLHPNLQKEIPKKIMTVWVGNQPIDDLLLNVLQQNLALVKAKDSAYSFRIYLSDEAMAVNAERLREKVSGIEIVKLEDTDIYRDFTASKNFQQYLDATSSGPGKTTNFASASDILRLAILKHEGGLYLDVDDVLTQNFGSQRLATWSDDSLLLGNPFINDSSGKPVFQCSNNIIGTQPANPTLDKILDEIHARYQRNPRFYTTRPDAADHQRMGFYMNKLFALTGGEVFTDVVAEAVPAIRDALEGWRKLDEFPIKKDDYFRKVFALADVFEHGEANSWVHH